MVEVTIHLVLKSRSFFLKSIMIKLIKLGMGISFVTTAKTNEEGRDLLKMFGMLFKEKIIKGRINGKD